MDVTTDANGNASFTFPSPVKVPAGQFITALATRLEAGTLAGIETSEFSAGIAVTAATAATDRQPVCLPVRHPQPGPDGRRPDL